MKPAHGDKQISIGETRPSLLAAVCVQLVLARLAALSCGCTLPPPPLHGGGHRCMFQKGKKKRRRRVILEGLGETGPPPLAMFLHLPTAPEAPGGCSPPFLFSTPPTRSSVALCVRAFPPRCACSVLRVPVVAPCELGSDARQCCLLFFVGFFLFFCFSFLEAAREKLLKWSGEGAWVAGDPGPGARPQCAGHRHQWHYKSWHHGAIALAD